MPWSKTREDRRRDAKTYQDPVYLRNKAVVRRRSRGRCECPGCRACAAGHHTRAVQCDHITPVTQGGTHDLPNLRDLCSGPGSCHAAKTATEGGGYRNASRPAGDPQPRPSTVW